MSTILEVSNQILNEKNTKIIPENIKKGVTIFDIEGTLEEGSGSSLPLNIFMQETEPEIKDGIWLQGNHEVENLIADKGVFTTEEWDIDKMDSLQVIPYPFYNTDAVIIGTDAYLFGSYYSSNTKKYAYKYDILTDTYTQLADLPYGFRLGGAVFNGLDIYLLGGSDNTKKVQVMTMTPKEYPNKSIIISQDKSINHSTNLADIGILNLRTYFDRVYYRDNNGQLLNNIPTYNGNGTTWTQI